MFVGGRHSRNPDPSSHQAHEPSNSLTRDSRAAHHVYPVRQYNAEFAEQHSGGHRSESAKTAERGKHAHHHRHRSYDTELDARHA